MNKPRADATLKTLPEERQAAIQDYLRTHTLADTKAWLAHDGLSTSVSALSYFRDWRDLLTSFRRTENDALNAAQLIKEQSLPNLSPEEVTRVGETLFNLAAIRTQDPKQFLAFQTAKHRARMDQAKLDQKERAIELESRKVKLLERKAAQSDQATQVLKEQLSPEEQQTRLKQIFGLA